MKRYIVLLSLTLLSLNYTSAETPIIDSLKRIALKTNQEALEKIPLLEDLVEKYILVDVDSALYYSDVLQSVISETNSSECNYYSLLGKIYKAQHNLILFEEQSLMALKCYEGESNHTAVAESRMELGIAKAYQGEIKEAHQLFDTSRELFFEQGDSLKAIKCSMHMGSLHMMLNERANGLEKYFEALEYFERKDDIEQLAKLSNNIGLAYSSFVTVDHNQEEAELSDEDKSYLDKALKFYQNSLIYSEMGEQKEAYNLLFLKSQSMANIASVYSRQDEYDIALGYLTKGLKLSKEIKSEYSVAIFNHDIAFAKNKIGKNYEALDAVNTSIPLFEKMNARDQVVRNYRLKADILMELSQYQAAHEACKRCYELSTGTQTPDVKKRALGCITRTSNALKLYKDAYLFQQQYIQVNDSIQMRNNKTRLKEEREKNKLESEQSLLVQKNKMNEILLKKEKANSRLYGMMSFLSIIGLSLLGLMLFQNRRNTTRIKEKNQEIESTLNELSKVNKDLGLVNEKLNNFTSVAAHDLKSPLRTISTYSQLLNMRNKETLKEKDQEMLHFVSSSSKQLSGMIDDLLAFSKLDKDLGVTQDVNIIDVVNLVKQNLQTSIQENNVTINVPYQLYTVKAHQNLLVQLFQNLISNGIKFKKEGQPVTIDIKTHEITNNKVTYSISDNGIGINPQHFDKIFTIFKRLNAPNLYEGSGIGLATCKGILDHYGQKIWVESEVGKGTTFYFTLAKA